MKNHNEKYEKLIGKFTEWAKKCKDIRTAVIVGSRARTEAPADKWSDLDMVIFVNDPDYYINNKEWLENIDDYWITFIEETAVGGGQERRVLFDGGLDVDFAIFSVEVVEKFNTSPEIQSILNRGYKVLFHHFITFGHAASLNEIKLYKQSFKFS